MVKVTEIGIFTFFALIAWALSAAGVLWISEFLLWLFNNSIIVGGVLLLIHLFVTIIKAKRVYFEYSTLGVICTIIHAIFPPVVIYSCYRVSLIAINDGIGNISFTIEWFLVLLCLIGTSYLGHLALDTENHLKSSKRLLGYTFLNIISSIWLIGMILGNGF